MTNMKIASICLPKSTYKKLEKLAKISEESKSRFICQLIEKEMIHYTTYVANINSLKDQKRF